MISETIGCIFCGKLSNQLAIKENGYNGLKCNDCNLIFISPRPSTAEISQIYTDNHAVEYADTQFQFEKYGRKEASERLKKIKKYRIGGQILELGPGGGFFLLEARKFGYEPYGVEVNPIEARWINDKLHIPCEDVPLSKDSFGGRKFDIIYHKDVLSHLYDPIGSLKDMNNSMKKGGLLVFETGNIGDVSIKHYNLFSEFNYPEHLFFFGEKSLEILLGKTGFKCLQIHRISIVLPLLFQKTFWRMKDVLKDAKTVENLRQRENLDPSGGRRLSIKRRLRLSYRYANHYLARFGAILPKKGWPLKLVIFAEKISDAK